MDGVLGVGQQKAAPFPAVGADPHRRLVATLLDEVEEFPDPFADLLLVGGKNIGHGRVGQKRPGQDFESLGTPGVGIFTEEFQYSIDLLAELLPGQTAALLDINFHGSPVQWGSGRTGITEDGRNGFS